MRTEQDYRFEPDSLPQAAAQRVRDVVDTLALESAADADLAARCLASSRFVTGWAAHHPHAFRALLQSDWALAEAPLTPDLASDALDSALRQARNASMVRLACRQTLALDSPEQTVRALSRLADELVGVCVEHHWARLCAERGTPRAADGQPVRPMVFALGKLGGRELNFSSDIDLVMAHSAAGEAEGYSIDQFMARLVQRVTKSLAAAQDEGFVYRVDWRLRPFGSQGAASASLAALDSYFEVHGRDWERYAWQKARCIAGDIAAGEAWLETLSPFIYRRYIDFGQLASLRAMKDEIDADVRSRGREQDIKRGWGGIREVEFSVQALQLIHGGARPSLQQRSLVKAVAALREEDVVDAAFATQWLQCYWFLRRVENAWQAVDDAQTHVLPSDEEPRQRLLCALGYPRWDAFEEELQRVRSTVRAHFLELFAPAERSELAPPAQALQSALLADELQWPAPFAELAAALESWQKTAQRRCSDTDHLRDLYDIGVRLLDACADNTTAGRVLEVLEAISGRGHYVVMLREHPEARRELLWLLERSSMIAAELVRHPALLVELCKPVALYAPPGRVALREHYQRQLAACDTDDVEARLEQLRRVRHAVGLRIAAADVAHALPLMRVSDHLTELAEETVRAALDVATQQMRTRWPELGALPLSIIAYGKLGGMELSYSSDLDLVFVYRAAPIPGVDQDPQMFYTRLVQKLINALATQTAGGRCYEVDMRLRPNGNSGLLVTSLEAFARYQAESAWTWEHQALVRARPIGGDADIGQEFTQLRAQILQRERDAQSLRGEIVDMRQKMRQELAPRDGRFDLKHSPGGLVDLEFYGQWLVLAHARSHPALTRFADLLRILETAASEDLLDPELEDALADRYRAMRAAIHAQALGTTAEAWSADARVDALLSDFYTPQAATD